MREIIPYFHELTIWLPIKLISLVTNYATNRGFSLKKKKKRTEKFGLTS